MSSNHQQGASIQARQHPSCSYQVSYEPPLRSFAELETERAYLLDSLEQDDARASHLLKHIAQISDSIPRLSGTKLKQCRKELTYFKRLLAETTHHEKSILARLGQVTYEIQWQERFTQLEIERSTWAMSNDMSRLQLNAELPESMPERGIINQQHFVRGYEVELPTDHLGNAEFQSAPGRPKRAASLSNTTDVVDTAKKRHSAPLVRAE